MSTMIRRIFPAMFAIVAFGSTGSTTFAQSGVTVSIVSPSDGIYLVAGNSMTVSTSITGTTTVAKVKVSIYDTASPLHQYSSAIYPYFLY